MNFIVAFKVSASFADSPPPCFYGETSDPTLRPRRKRKRKWGGRPRTGSDTQFTLHLCKLYQTGESSVAPAQREPEQNNRKKKKKQSREEKSVKPVALTYLTAVVWAEQWELGKSESVFSFSSSSLPPSPFFLFCSESITVKDKVAFLLWIQINFASLIKYHSSYFAHLGIKIRSV